MSIEVNDLRTMIIDEMMTTTLEYSPIGNETIKEIGLAESISGGSSNSDAYWKQKSDMRSRKFFPGIDVYTVEYSELII